MARAKCLKGAFMAPFIFEINYLIRGAATKSYRLSVWIKALRFMARCDLIAGSLNN
ncbi:hypothetical protein MED121_22989 [Marinomonas sp. MED121]|nr:hypothetical protein MED121_22989 [Marinomonas sp. MED121]